MNKFLSLTRVLCKNTAGMLSDGKTKKSRVYLLYIFLAICCLPMLGTLYFLFETAIQQLSLLHQEGAVLAIGFHATNLVTFVFSIFLIPSVFYFSKDSETLLTLPLKPHVILSSKFVVCLLYEYIVTLAIAIPLLIAFVSNIEVTFLFYIIAPIILVLLPVYPLVLSSVISMLVMRFVPFFKNRDRFNMIGGILAVALAFGFSFFMNSSSMQNVGPDALVEIIFSGNNSMIQLFAYLFPAIPFAADALVFGDILQLIGYLGILVLSLVVFIVMGKYFYFKGAIGFNETGSNRKAISSKDMKKASRKQSKIHSYMAKELKLLVRTPSYFLNCILMVFVMPILFVVMYFTSASSLNLSSLNVIDFTPYLPYALFVGLAFGFFYSNMNMISSTAISREGTNMMFMKYIPMPLGKQIHAKANVGIIMAIISMLFTIIIAYVMFPFLPITFYLGAFLTSLISIILGNYFGIIVDMAHPKLIWEQEAAAVKQNMSGMIGMFGGWLIIVPLGYLIYKLPFDYTMIIFIVIAVVLILINIVLYIRMEKIAQYFFKKL